MIVKDLCAALCLVFAGGFVSTAVLAATYILESRADGRRGFAGLRMSYVWCGALVCAALWPVVVLVLFVDAVRKGGS